MSLIFLLPAQCSLQNTFGKTFIDPVSNDLLINISKSHLENSRFEQPVGDIAKSYRKLETVVAHIEARDKKLLRNLSRHLRHLVLIGKSPDDEEIDKILKTIHEAASEISHVSIRRSALFSTANLISYQSSEFKRASAISKILHDTSKAQPKTLGFSNADLPSFFKNQSDWKTVDSRVYVFPQRTDAKWELERDGKSELLVECVVTEGSKEALAVLDECLQGYEIPVDQVLSVKRDTTWERGQVVLEDADQKRPLTLLWVYGNCFVRMEQLGSTFMSNRQSCYDLARALSKHIANGAVAKTENIAVPGILDIEGPEQDQVTTDEVFLVNVWLRSKSYSYVSCDIDVSYSFT